MAETRQDHAEILAARERRRLADATPQLVWICEPDGECELLSRSWLEYTGVPEAAQRGLGWLDVVHPDDRTRVIAAWREAGAGGLAFDAQLRLRRHDGVHQWFHAVAQPLTDDDPGATRLVGNATDVDDLRRAEEEREGVLARAQRHATEVEAIFSAHADGLVIYGPDGKIRSMNPAAREMFGLGEGDPADYRDVVRRLEPVDEFGDPIEADLMPSRRAMRGELVRGVVVGVHTRRGLAWHSASAAPLRSPDGAVAGAVLSLVDVTHLRRLKEERELVIRALTHDARTRLNVIRTHGEILGRAEVTDSDARRRGGIIVSSSQLLARTIDALVEGGA